MFDRQADYLFHYLIQELPQDKQHTLWAMFEQCKRNAWCNSMREKEQLKKEIAEEVLSQISTTLDISDCLKKIDELQRALDNLCK